MSFCNRVENKQLVGSRPKNPAKSRFFSPPPGLCRWPYVAHAFAAPAASADPALASVPFDLGAHVVVDHGHDDGVEGLILPRVWTDCVQFVKSSRDGIFFSFLSKIHKLNS